MDLHWSRWCTRILALLGVVIHAGTALLRLDTFWPYPKLFDFAAFYAGAWALRQHGSPYALLPPLRERLVTETGLTFGVPALNSFPIWPWLLQPLTWLTFPLAAWIWLLINLGLLLWCTGKLGDMAGISPGRRRVWLFGLVLTFGPVTLNLTLGQTGILLLALALAVGRQFRRQPAVRSGWDPLVQTVGVGSLWLSAMATKLFPLLWLPGLVFLRGRRALGVAFGAMCAFVLLHVVLLPRMTWRYLTQFLPGQADRLTTGTLDDQSLLAWLLRISQPMDFQTPGLFVFQQHRVVWSPPVPVDPDLVRGVCWVLLAGTGTALGWWLWHRRTEQPEPHFYLWVLFSLLVFPHMERYNHTLLLPAMAWLWGQGESGRRRAVIGYFLAGLARLTHLWVLVLPWPWGPLATGFGVVAVLALMFGMVRLLPQAW